jgi:hypothetical protein
LVVGSPFRLELVVGTVVGLEIRAARILEVVGTAEADRIAAKAAGKTAAVVGCMAAAEAAHTAVVAAVDKAAVVVAAGAVKAELVVDIRLEAVGIVKPGGPATFTEAAKVAKKLGKNWLTG